MKTNYIIKEFYCIDSTSTYLKKNYLENENMTIVSALKQLDGHGRMNRKWISNEGENLMFSILIKDKDLINDFSSLSLASAVVIYNALNKLQIKNVSIKWPNDVYVKDKKICGILLESVSYDGEIKALVIGVGLNVNSIFDNTQLENTATSIYKETNTKYELNVIKDIVYNELDCVLSNNNFNNYLEVVRKNNYLKDKEVYCEINNKKELVKVLDINDDNSLKVLLNNKEINLISSEISFHK